MRFHPVYTPSNMNDRGLHYAVVFLAKEVANEVSCNEIWDGEREDEGDDERYALEDSAKSGVATSDNYGGNRSDIVVDRVDNLSSGWNVEPETVLQVWGKFSKNHIIGVS